MVCFFSLTDALSFHQDFRLPLFFLALGAALLFAGEGWSVTLGRGDILTLFAAVCLARDLLFLGYERFAP